MCSRSTRFEIAHSLVETLRTLRGEDADTAAERRAIGQDVARMGRQLRTPEEKAEGQGRRSRTPWVERTDTGAEGRAVSADVRRAQAGFACTR